MIWQQRIQNSGGIRSEDEDDGLGLKLLAEGVDPQVEWVRIGRSSDLTLTFWNPFFQVLSLSMGSAATERIHGRRTTGRCGLKTSCRMICQTPESSLTATMGIQAPSLSASMRRRLLITYHSICKRYIHCNPYLSFFSDFPSSVRHLNGRSYSLPIVLAGILSKA